MSDNPKVEQRHREKAAAWNVDNSYSYLIAETNLVTGAPSEGRLVEASYAIGLAQGERDGRRMEREDTARLLGDGFDGETLQRMRGEIAENDRLRNGVRKVVSVHCSNRGAVGREIARKLLGLIGETDAGWQEPEELGDDD